MKLDMTLRDLMRAQDVTRWQIVRCGRVQSIAEHSWAVGVIAQRLWAVRHKFPHDLSKGMVATLADLAHAAMWHDVPEVFTGDINTPTKVYLKACVPGVADALDTLESTAGEMYRAAMDISAEMKDCLKLADYLEAIYFLQEYGQGTYARTQHEGLVARMMEFCRTVDEPGQWREPVLQVLEELMSGSEETTTFDRVGALLDKASS